MDVLGEPQRTYPSIHITGTNGKTSTARMIEALLRAFELRTGRYTSPHVRVGDRADQPGRRADQPPSGSSTTYDDIEPYIEMVDAGAAVPALVLRGAHRHGVRGVRRRAGRRRRRRGRHGRHLGRHQRASTAPVAVVTPIALDHTDRLGDTPGEIAGGEGRDHQARRHRGPRPAAGGRRAGAAASGPSRWTRRWPARAWSSAWPHREVAVGGQLLTLRGLGGEYDELFLPLHGAHQAHNAARGAGRGRGVLRRRRAHAAQPLDLDTVRAGVRRGHLAGPARGGPPQPRPSCWTPRTTRRARGPPRRRSREAFGFTRLVGVVAASGGQGRPRGAGGVRAGPRRGRGHPELQPPRDGRGRAGARSPSRSSATTGCRSSPAWTTRSRRPITLAEEEGEFAGAGVLVTGSVITVGEARLLLGRGADVRCERLCASTLIGEVVRDRLRRPGRDERLRTTRRGTVWTVCGVAMALCVLLCGMITRPGAVAVGWVLQVGADRLPASWSR